MRCNIHYKYVINRSNRMVRCFWLSSPNYYIIVWLLIKKYKMQPIINSITSHDTRFASISRQDSGKTQFVLKNTTQNYVLLIVTDSKGGSKPSFCICGLFESTKECFELKEEINKAAMSKYKSKLFFIIVGTHELYPLLDDVEKYSDEIKVSKIRAEIIDNHIKSSPSSTTAEEIVEVAEPVDTKFGAERNISESCGAIEEKREDSLLTFKYPLSTNPDQKWCAMGMIKGDDNGSFLLLFLQAFDNEEDCKFYIRTTAQKNIDTIDLYHVPLFELLTPEIAIQNMKNIQTLYRDKHLADTISSITQTRSDIDI